MRTASAGSKASSRSAVPRRIIGLLTPSPMRRWLKTAPPFWAMPMVSALMTGRPLAMAAAAMSFEASTVPWPPTPVRMIFFCIISRSLLPSQMT